MFTVVISFSLSFSVANAFIVSIISREIVDLPHGTRVYPHDQSVRKAKTEGTKIYRFEKIADTVIVRNDEDIDAIVDEIVDKLEAIPV